MGTLLPAVMLLTAGAGAGTLAAAGLALAGLLAYEHAFVMSGQAVPIS